jgi:hypothetical protein
VSGHATPDDVVRVLHATVTDAHTSAVALEARRKAHSAAAAAIQARVEQCIIDHEMRISLAQMALEHHQRVEDFLYRARL